MRTFSNTYVPISNDIWVLEAVFWYAVCKLHSAYVEIIAYRTGRQVWAYLDGLYKLYFNMYKVCTYTLYKLYLFRRSGTPFI